MSEFNFIPPDRGALWARLRLTPTQLAALSGLSFRQVVYWSRRGYLVAVASDPPRYDGNALDTCILLKQALDAGIQLERARTLVSAHLAAELKAQPDAGVLATVGLEAVRAELRGAITSLEVVLQVVDMVASHEGVPDARYD